MNDPKQFLVRLSLPIEAPSMKEAIETFLDILKEGDGWAFTVTNDEGQFIVDTQIEEIDRIATITNMKVLNFTPTPKEIS